jgi:hypothetical protein
MDFGLVTFLVNLNDPFIRYTTLFRAQFLTENIKDERFNKRIKFKPNSDFRISAMVAEASHFAASENKRTGTVRHTGRCPAFSSGALDRFPLAFEL